MKFCRTKRLEVNRISPRYNDKMDDYLVKFKVACEFCELLKSPFQLVFQFSNIIAQTIESD